MHGVHEAAGSSPVIPTIRMENIEEQLRQICERNKRVEAEKAWETSWIRRLTIAAMTYVTACMFLWLIASPSFALSALVPTGGYLLSTLSLPWIKQRWLQRNTQ